jgi:hypothetical protein
MGALALLALWLIRGRAMDEKNPRCHQVSGIFHFISVSHMRLRRCPNLRLLS